MTFKRPIAHGVFALMAWAVFTTVTAGGEPTAGMADESEPVNCAVDRKVKPLSEIAAELRIDILDVGSDATADEDEDGLPPDCSTNLFDEEPPAGTLFASRSTLHWRPTNFFHQPLYFDDQPLERYGQSVCPHLQPAISATRFFLTLPAVPYKIGVDHPYDCVTTLGKYRPGGCAPCVKEVLPRHDLDGALLTTATAMVMVFCLP